MPKQKIPDREPIADTAHGVINQVGTHYLLSKETLSSATPIADGEFVIRYGIPYLGKPHISIVPDLVVLDYGDMLTGEDAWEFLINQSNLYPRSDVLGYRNDGSDEMVVIKQLDFAIPFKVFAYISKTDHQPIAQLDALITTNYNHYPERLIKYLPCFNTIADWQASHE